MKRNPTSLTCRRESNTVLDSGVHSVDSGFLILDFGFFDSGT